MLESEKIPESLTTGILPKSGYSKETCKHWPISRLTTIYSTVTEITDRKKLRASGKAELVASRAKCVSSWM